ncbi:MAG: hypothetical protein PR2021_6250 [Candidatus Phytoplasma pruni]|nr:MAG: hypothetical protein PR2021_6250 [Candidatus Phytoplasma pruni]
MFKFYLNRKTTLFTYHLLFQEFHNLIQQEKEITTTSSNPFQKQHQTKQPYDPIDECQIQIIKNQLLKEVSPLFNQIRDYYHYLLITNQNNESSMSLEYF